MAAGFLWLEGELTVPREVVVPGAVLDTVLVPEGALVTVLPLPLTAALLPKAEPFLMAVVPAVLVAVVLRVEAVLDIVPVLLPEVPLTVEPPLSEVLPANILSEPVWYL